VSVFEEEEGNEGNEAINFENRRNIVSINVEDLGNHSKTEERSLKSNDKM